GDGSKVAHAAEQSSGDARRTARASRDLVGAVGSEPDAEDARAAIDDLFQLSRAVKAQPHRNAKAVAQRIGEKARARRRADEREPREIDFHRPRRRPLADNQIELEILHRRIKDFLYCRIEAMNFIDEQHVTRFEIGKKRGEIAGLGDYRPGSGAEV